MRPADLPPADRYAHGTRARYVSGCRCDDCRRANRLYERARYAARAGGDWNGLKAGAVRQDGVWGRPSPTREIAA